ncbi:hypothetical protein [Bdellovibrio reynosensis]|uniref:Type II secretion system protein GspG C-terminal domain-containing protein n=1 Tax=Bdellovibrio reynosensis TaxID=2835041 RepID=A0ABY4C9B1_9BACT|nr:hypothetical protein [Bdellovibrio reynosensis]UOF00221.1 hypothetical protein MNR06_10965 [Bdellovibrio reynosensis]
MKIEEKQEFKSTSVLALLGLVGFSFAIIATPWNRHMQDSKVETARQRAEVVGYQIVQIYREATRTAAPPESVGGRKIASVAPDSAISMENLRTTGTMGNDPWGRPFRYRILSQDHSGKVRILVWSTGPNQKLESLDLEDEESAIKDPPLYSGDDMGVLLSMSQN